MLRPLHQLISDDSHPAPWVCHDGRQLVSWHAFVERVLTEVSYLNSRDENRWLLCNENPLEFAILFFALLHAHKHIVIPPNALAGTLADLDDAYDAIATSSISATANHPATHPAIDLPALNIHTKCIDLYTSGSTGKPKRIQKTLAQFELELDILEQLWGDVIGQSTIISTVPHHHIYGLIFRILWPLSAGKVFDVLTCRSPEDIVDRARLFESSVLVSSPAQLSRFFELPHTTPSTTYPKQIFSSGGALSAANATQFQQAFGSAPIEIYGSTETGGIAWRCQSNDSAWTTLPGVQVQTESMDQPSTAMLRSPMLFDTPVAMDDLVEMLPNHTFHLRGRADRVVKVEQKRLSLTDMEHMLCKHDWIDSAAALVISGRKESIAIVATLKPAGAQSLSSLGRHHFIQPLRAHLSQHFETVLLPRYWRFVEALPVNATGKVTQQSLSALFNLAETDANSAKANHVIA